MIETEAETEAIPLDDDTERKLLREREEIARRLRYLRRVGAEDTTAYVVLEELAAALDDAWERNGAAKRAISDARRSREQSQQTDRERAERAEQRARQRAVRWLRERFDGVSLGVPVEEVMADASVANISAHDLRAAARELDIHAVAGSYIFGTESKNRSKTYWAMGVLGRFGMPVGE